VATTESRKKRASKSLQARDEERRPVGTLPRLRNDLASVRRGESWLALQVRLGLVGGLGHVVGGSAVWEGELVGPEVVGLELEEEDPMSRVKGRAGIELPCCVVVWC
jgi:hypothetical protein